MNEKIKFTPEQLAEIQSFFHRNDFTANMTLDREYDFNGKQSHFNVCPLIQNGPNYRRCRCLYLPRHGELCEAQRQQTDEYYMEAGLSDTG